MATAEELLSGSASVDDKTLVVDNDLRTIIIPSGVKNLGVATDDEVLTLKFKMPRYVSDTDLSIFSIRVLYTNAKGDDDLYTVNNPTIAANHITFSWLVGPTATKVKGTTKFSICAVLLDSDGYIYKEFNTSPVALEVLEGLEANQKTVTLYSDVIEQWRQELFGIGDTEEANMLAVSEAQQTAIENKGAEVLATIPEDYTATYNLANEGVRSKADAIICSAQGESVSISDASDDYIRGLNVYGKSAQVSTTGGQLFDSTSIGANAYTSIGDDGTITIDCDNSDGESSKYATFYTPVSEVLSGDTTYTIVCEIFSATNAGENIYLTSHYSDELCQFSDTVVITSPTVGIHVRTAQTYSTFDDCKYMCRGFMTIPAGTHIKAIIRVSISADTTVTEDTFVYEPYSGGYVSPSPDWSQEITSIESPTASIYGANLFPTQSITGFNIVATPQDDGSVLYEGTSTDNFWAVHQDCPLPITATYTLHVITTDKTEKGSLVQIYSPTGTITMSQVNTVEDYYLTFQGEAGGKLRWNIGATPDEVVNARVKLMVNIGDNALDWEPYDAPQTVTPTHTLRGIPVGSLGNYTDANGQQWAADYVDFERGVLVQRIAYYEFTGSDDEAWSGIYNYGSKDIDYANIHVLAGSDAYSTPLFCSQASRRTWNEEYTCFMNEYDRFVLGGAYFADYMSDINTFKTYLSVNPVKLAYVLATPIETALTADEIAAFKTLHSNYPNTTVVNDSGAMMELKYNADTETWISNMIDSKISAALANL